MCPSILHKVNQHAFALQVREQIIEAGFLDICGWCRPIPLHPKYFPQFVYSKTGSFSFSHYPKRRAGSNRVEHRPDMKCGQKCNSKLVTQQAQLGEISRDARAVCERSFPIQVGYRNVICMQHDSIRWRSAIQTISQNRYTQVGSMGPNLMKPTS